MRLRRGATGFVYFAQVGGARGPVKIGWTSNVDGRIATLRTDHWKSVELLLVIAGTMRDEALLHRTFAKERIEREWFRPSKRLLKAVADIESAVTTHRLEASVLPK